MTINTEQFKLTVQAVIGSLTESVEIHISSAFSKFRLRQTIIDGELSTELEHSAFCAV